MKRSGFKKKTYEEVKAMWAKKKVKRTALKKGGPLRKKSKQKISLLQRKIWEHCKRIIRSRHGNACYTCGRSGLEGRNWQTGHMWAKAALGAYMKYDLRILRPQCYHCNMNCGGMGAIFYKKMLDENGHEYMYKLELDRQVEVRAYEHYEKLLIEYSVI